MAGEAQIDMRELHWLLDIVQCLDVGVLVMDRNFRVEVWNSFMENHSGLGADQVQGRSLFQLFPEIDRVWLERKVGTVLRLGTRAFSLWQQRPYLLRFETSDPELYALIHPPKTDRSLRSRPDILRGLRCDMVQGYLFSRPLPAEDFRQWHAAHETDRISASHQDEPAA